MRLRLSILMFLQYAPPGAVLPLYSVHLVDGLGFTPLTTAYCCATQALATVLAAFVAGQVADRWIPANRVLTACAFLAGIDLWVLAGLQEPLAVFTATLVFWLLCGPILMLGTAIGFTHLEFPERDFGRVRLWGTAGWMAAGWLLAVWLSQPGWLLVLIRWSRPAFAAPAVADSFYLGAALAFVLGFYGLTLPHTPPSSGHTARAAPLAAMRLLKHMPFAVYCVCTFFLSMTLPFTAQATPLLLKQLGVTQAWLVPTLTIAQISEVISLAFLPLFLASLGMRWTMLLGLAAWCAALSILTMAEPMALVVSSLGFNGLCIAGFFVAGQVFVNRLASGDVRASVQALLTFTNGAGLLIGNLLVGVLRERTRGNLSATFACAAIIAVVLLAGFFVAFWPGESEKVGEGNAPERT